MLFSVTATRFFAPVLAEVAAAEDTPAGFVVLMGMGTVFIGLICIVALCAIMSWLCRRFASKEQAQPAAPAAQAAAPAAPTPTEDRAVLLAAISAAIAEESGTDLSAIRILSVKRV